MQRYTKLVFKIAFPFGSIQNSFRLLWKCPFCRQSLCWLIFFMVFLSLCEISSFVYSVFWWKNVVIVQGMTCYQNSIKSKLKIIWRIWIPSSDWYECLPDKCCIQCTRTNEFSIDYFIWIHLLIQKARQKFVDDEGNGRKKEERHKTSKANLGVRIWS